ncbi:MAG: response regulator [Calditrichaeota bacterium]|nr:response regulator [Calditrichota bacterium]
MTDSPKILLAEDDQNDIELTLSALAEVSVPRQEIAVVNDGEEALHYLFRRGKFSKRDKQNPILILLDIKMPKIDGHEVLREVKAHPELKQIPVVMLTSSGMERDINKSYYYGVNAYVVKPVNFSEFQQAVRMLGDFWIKLNKVSQ